MDQTTRYRCHVLPPSAFRVVSGANEGDPLTAPDTLVPGDVYVVKPGARVRALEVATERTTQRHRVASGSGFGPAGAQIDVVARAGFFSPQGESVDVLLLMIERAGLAALPLEPLPHGVEFVLADVGDAPEGIRLSEVLSVGLARGTMITLSNGGQKAVEDLAPGDLLLTRDHGGQPLRQVIHRTLRAVGPYAPVVIPKGLMNNDVDMILSQHQRLFLYQTDPGERLTATAETLVRADHLVDGERVFVREGGFTDYFTLVLDNHEMVYAEGIPVESLEVSSETREVLPDEVAEAVDPALSHTPHVGTEADRKALTDSLERLFRDP